MTRSHQPIAPASEVSGIAAGVVAGAMEGSQARAAAAEHAYWQQHFRELPSVGQTARYEQYAPAFEYGWQRRQGCCAKPPAQGLSGNRPSFEAAEDELRQEWQQRPAAAVLSWDMARDAVRAAWERVDEAMGSNDEPKPGAR